MAVPSHVLGSYVSINTPDLEARLSTRRRDVLGLPSLKSRFPVPSTMP